MAMRFPSEKNAGCPKAPRDFPPSKEGILLPLPWNFPPPPPPPESVRTYGWAYADVSTKISRMDRLPDFLTHGAPLVRFAGASLLLFIYSLIWDLRLIGDR